MTPTEREHVWQQHITDWQTTGVSGSAYPLCKQQSLAYRFTRSDFQYVLYIVYIEQIEFNY
jgi:hypothetical protein